MEILRDWYKRCFGENEGLELIAARLRNGVPYVKAYDRNDGVLVYFKGTGEYLGGWGNKRRYDVKFQILGHHKGYGEILSDFKHVSQSRYMDVNLPELDGSYLIELRDQVGENDPEEVIAWLGKIASRLKPHQTYNLVEMNITNDLFAGDRIRLYHGKREILVPREYIGNRRLITEGELGTVFNGNKVNIFDDEKIKREHRKNTDPKRWFVTKKVDSVNDKHAIRFTHRKTANAPIHYYSMEIIADSKAMAGHPFYVEELLGKAVNALGDKHPASEYHLEIFTSNIDFTWDNKTVSVDTYRDNQSKYPAGVDKQPLLIYPELVVIPYVTHDSGSGYYIRDKAKVEAEKTTRKEVCHGSRRSR